MFTRTNLKKNWDIVVAILAIGLFFISEASADYLGYYCPIPAATVCPTSLSCPYNFGTTTCITSGAGTYGSCVKGSWYDTCGPLSTYQCNGTTPGGSTCYCYGTDLGPCAC